MIRQLILEYCIQNLGTVLGASILLITMKKLFSDFLNEKNNKLRLIPYKFPFVGSTLEYYKNPNKLIKKFTKTYGPRFRMHFHGEVMTVVGAEDSLEVLNHPDLSFIVSENKYFSMEILHGSQISLELLNKGVNCVLKNLIPNLNEYSVKGCKEILRDVKDLDGANKEFIVDDLAGFLKKFISRSSASMVVGTELCRNETLFYIFENAVTDIGKSFMPGVSRVIFPALNKIYLRYFYKKSGAVEKYRKLTRRILEPEIERLRHLYQKDSSHSIISYAIYTHFPEMNEETVETLVTMLLFYIFVASHITSEALCYVFYCLVKHPEYMDELRKEQEELFSEFSTSPNAIRIDDEIVPTNADCRRMAKLDSFIHEALRIRKGSIGHAHTNYKDHDVLLKCGAVIKPGEEVYINQWHINFDENNQSPFENLEIFDGFRYVKTDRITTRSGHDNIVFGWGKHTCPGRWFAMYQIKVIISYFIRNYDITAVTDIKMGHSEEEYVGLPKGAVKFTKRNASIFQ